MTDSYKIFPSIGIARVGNSEGYYLAPTTAGGLPTMADGSPFTQADFRDLEKKLRRQGAHFTIY